MNCEFYANCNHKDCENDFCLRRNNLMSLYNASLLSDAQIKPTVIKIDADNTDRDTFIKLKDIANNIVMNVKNGKNIYLYSSQCGNGKTTWAVRLIKEYFNNIWPRSIGCKALFISVPRFLLAIKDNISNKSEYVTYIKDNILNADLVVWDDLGAKVNSEFEINHILNFIDNRLSYNKANIYTSNLNPEQLAGALGERVASRVINCSEVFEFKGADKRKLFVGDNR